MIDCTHVIEFCKKKVKVIVDFLSSVVSNRRVRAFGRSSGRTELYYTHIPDNSSH